MRALTALAGAALLALVIAPAAAANDSVRWTDTHDIDNTFSCGVIENTTATIDGTAYFDEAGSWLKDILRFTYDASFRDPATGRTIEFRTRQVVESTPSSVTFRGQGVFVRVPGEGAVLLDVGRLIIDPADGSTLFRSAKALALDDPTVAARYDAAICSLF